MKSARILEDVSIPVRIKLSALWGTVMLLYIYNDLFMFFRPGFMAAMIAGDIGPAGPAAQWVLLAMSAAIAIPTAMVFLSLVLKPRANRWTNLIIGAAYALMIPLTIAAPPFWANYVFLGLIETALTILIVWQAWTWPSVESKEVEPSVSGAAEHHRANHRH